MDFENQCSSLFWHFNLNDGFQNTVRISLAKCKDLLMGSCVNAKYLINYENNYFSNGIIISVWYWNGPDANIFNVKTIWKTEMSLRQTISEPITANTTYDFYNSYSHWINNGQIDDCQLLGKDREKKNNKEKRRPFRTRTKDITSQVNWSLCVHETVSR